jgi:hypothetical protein
VFAAFLAGGPTLEAQTTLKYKFKSGDTLQYAMHLATKRTLRAEKELTATEKQDITMTWRVESVDDKGTAKIQLKVDRVVFTAEGPAGKTEVASDAKEEPKDDTLKIASANAKAMSMIEGTFTLTAQGEVGKVTVSEAALKEIRAIPNWEKTPEEAVVQTVQATLRDNVLNLPAEAITKGKTWKHKIEGMSPYGPFTGEMEYTFEGDVNRGGRTLSKFLARPKLKIEPDEKAKVKITIKSHETEGESYFDNAAGRVVEVITMQRIEVQADVEGKTISQRTEVTNSFKLVKAGK